VLSSIGCGDLLAPIMSVLATPTGTSTFGALAFEIRNTLVAHPGFTFEAARERVFGHFDIAMSENSEQFARLDAELIRLTRDLVDYVCERYPGGASGAGLLSESAAGQAALDTRG
jgi:hypothetical protein